MNRKLARNVQVDGTWYRPGDSPPPEVAERILNPKAWEDTEDRPEPALAAPVEQVPDGPLMEPPRTGSGSGLDAWKAYADQEKLAVPEGAKRDDIIAIVDAARE